MPVYPWKIGDIRFGSNVQDPNYITIIIDDLELYSAHKRFENEAGLKIHLPNQPNEWWITYKDLDGDIEQAKVLVEQKLAEFYKQFKSEFKVDDCVRIVEVPMSSISVQMYDEGTIKEVIDIDHYLVEFKSGATIKGLESRHLQLCNQ